MSDIKLRDFLELPYEQIEELNLESKRQRMERVAPDQIREQRAKYLTDERRIKAVTVLFSDLEGRLHTLDYDKKFLLSSLDNLTFDGSSIRGFTEIAQSDLILEIDWSSFYWLPSDFFGPGKVVVFGTVLNRDRSPFASDFRARLHNFSEELLKRDGVKMIASAEIEGFLFKGREAERRYHETDRFDLISIGGYFHSLPQDPLRQFIDAAAEVQRAMAFGNEKDHPEVGPSQFEMNFGPAEATIAADQIQLYKLICRQVAHRFDMTASFLPKPITGINGNGMHTNVSLSKGGKNIFYDAKGRDRLSEGAWNMIGRLLNNADDLCLVANASVNAYRRLDPNYEAPNEIKASPVDRSSMIRVPHGNERSARIEVRSVGPDSNPYMWLYTVLRVGLEGPEPTADEDKRPRTRILPDNINAALRSFKRSPFMKEILGEVPHAKYAMLKKASADRCPRLLGKLIKRGEILYHHEVTNQMLWATF
ncbi:MAG: glutamine synthetase [Phycisphaerales bacterium]|nr:glutamine synthetase [Phycisphaerales bacterium]